MGMCSVVNSCRGIIKVGHQGGEKILFSPIGFQRMLIRYVTQSVLVFITGSTKQEKQQ
jgi:hypothetical protein